MEFIRNNIFLVTTAVVSGVMLLWSFFGRRLMGVAEIGTLEATRLINQKDALVLDVRDEGEFKAGHIPNSRHIPLAGIGSRLKELEKFRKRPVVIICRSGSRSGAAAGILKKSGFNDVVVLQGGLTAWAQANLPVEKT